MRVVVVGNRALARHVFRHLLETGWNVVGVVEPAESAASRQANFESMAAIAEKHDVERIETTDINSAETREELSALTPDICLCPGWSQIIGQAVLDIPQQGFLGLHSSRLPAGRGGAPVNWSLIHGADSVTISLFYYTTGVDAGDVLAQKTVPVQSRDDVSTVFDRLAVAACDAVDDVATVVQNGDGRAASIPQDLAEATYRPRRQPQDGRIDWDQPADTLADWVRAQTHPYPGAYSFFGGERLQIWRANPVPETDEGGHSPGTVVNVVPEKGVDVATSEGLLRLERVQLGSRPERWADEFATRHDVTVGCRFGRQHAPSGWLYTGFRDSSGGTQYQTNLTTGRLARLLAVLDAPTSRRTVTVTAEIDGEQTLERTVDVDGHVTVPIEYGSEREGTRTLRLRFSEAGETLDTRYLKFFVTA